MDNPIKERIIIGMCFAFLLFASLLLFHPLCKNPSPFLPFSPILQKNQTHPNQPRSPRKNPDVREPHELADTGRIPGAVNMPLNSHPNAIFVEPVTFYRTFGFLKPGTTRAQAVPKTNKNNTDPAAAVPPEGPVGGPVGGAVEEEKEEDKEEEQRVNEVVFYCKSGVRSKLAAQMAMNEIGWVPAVQSGDLTGGWIEWQAKGGKVEKVG